MSTHKDRADKRAENTAPENFTCGKCKKVVPYSEGYKCPHCYVKPVKPILPDGNEEAVEEAA